VTRGAALVLGLAGCAAALPAVPADHPASTTAPIGRIAGAPAALRPGVVHYDGLPAPDAAPTPMQHHHHPAS
jgi:hypothetical protein